MKSKTPAFVLMLLLVCAMDLRAQEETETTDFSEIKGRVVDSSGKPIEKFKVNLRVYDYSEGGWSVQPKVVKKWEGEFENGEFQFDVDEPVECNDKVYLSRTITAEGFLEANRNGSWTLLSSFKGKFGKIRLDRGITVTGKVVMPDSQSDEELIEPKVWIAKKMKGLVPDYNNMFQQYCSVQKDGTFEVVVPENIKLHVAASSRNAATFDKVFTIPKSESEDSIEDIGELKLKEGVSVSGVVVDRDNQPVEGQIVQLEQNIQTHRHMQHTVYGYCITDADGKFKLPPREGESKISLVQQAHIDNKMVKVKDKLIMSKPVNLTLKIGREVADIEIRESKTWRIHGFVRYDDAKPMIYASSANGSQSNIELGDDGSFEFEVVDGTSPYMMIYQNSGSKIYMASLSGESLKKFGHHFKGSPKNDAQYFPLKEIEADIGPLEFHMVQHIPDNRTVLELLFDWYYFGE